MLLEQLGSVEHLGLLLRGTRGEQDVLLGDTVADGEHTLEQGRIGVVAQTAHLARRAHIDTENRVGLLQAVEGELAGLDTDIVEVEEILLRLLHGHAEHDLRGQVDEVELQDLRDKREGTRGTEVALDDVDVVLAGHKLDVERTVDMERLGDLTADALDAAHGLDVEFLRRELDCSIT